MYPLLQEDQDTCQQVYEERKRLVKGWFRQWTSHQQKQFLMDIMTVASQSQKNYLDALACLSLQHIDFTRHLPQVLTLHIFSYLDPRSLSRCAQVCWYWKYLSEMNLLWMPKCTSLGWYLPASTKWGINDLGHWKKLFIQNLSKLKNTSRPPVSYSLPMVDTATMTDEMKAAKPDETLARRGSANSSTSLNTSSWSKLEDWRPMKPQHRTLVIPDSWMKTYDRPLSSSCSTTCSITRPVGAQETTDICRKAAPWRGSTRKPKDIIRYNYLDNDNAVWEMSQARVKNFGKHLSKESLVPANQTLYALQQ